MATPDNQLFFDAFNASPIGITVENLEGQPLFVNPALCAMLGFSEEEMHSKHCVDFSPPEDAEKDRALFQQLRTGSIDHYHIEKRFLRRDGTLLWGRLSVSLLNRPAPLVVAMVEDITEKKRAEMALLRHAAIVESSDDAIAGLDRNGTITDWNKGAERLFGYSASEAIGENILFLSLADARDDAKGVLKKVWQGEVVRHHETVRRRKDGTSVDISLTVSPIVDSLGRIVGASGIARDITERKRVEQEHAVASERLHLAIESGSVGGWDYDLKTGKNVWFGDAQAQLGIAPDETSGSLQEFWDHVYAEDRERLQHAIRVAGDTHQGFSEDFRAVWRDGTVHWLRSRGQYYYSAKGEPERMLGISLDITQSKQAEQALRESEQRFRLAAQAGKMYSFEWDVTTDVVVRSPERVKVLGATEPLRSSHQLFVDTIHPDDRPRFMATIAGLTPENPTAECIYRVCSCDGALVWLKSSGRAFFDDEGRLRRVIGMVADVTDQKRTEEALRASEERLRLAQWAARVGTFDWNIGTGVNTWTAELEAMYGLSPGTFGGTQAAFEKLVHPDDRARVIELVEGALKTGQPTSGEWRVIWPDGSVHWISGHWQVLMNDSGEPSRMTGVNRDVTERKRAELILRETNRALEEQTALLQAREELLKIFVKNVPAGVAMLDRDMRYVQVSERWCADYGLDSSDVIGRSHHGLFPDIPPRWKEMHRRALQGETLRVEEDCWDRTGGTVWVYWEVRPWMTLDGTPGGILIFAEDITRRKQMEEALSCMTRKLIESQEQERARIGRELHDDINQRIAMLALELEQLQQNPCEVESRVQELRKSTAELSNDVQALSHDLHSSKLEYLGVVAGIRSWCKEFGERQKVEIDFRSDVSSPVPLQIGLSLFRVLQEALTNVIKHSGVRRVEVQLHEKSAQIQLVISDSGSGFNVESALQGRGLGLTSMRERVRLVNGTIAIESKPMDGTTVDVRVPLESTNVSQRAAG